MTTAAIISLISLVFAFFASVIGIAFRLGHHAARLESLEKWRDGIRNDMHEISDRIEKMSIHFQELTTLIEERTDRRTTFRTPVS